MENFRNFKTQTWPPKPTFTEANVPAGSQAGRVFMVTGGNTGIGFELCKILFASGAKIYMASRSKDKADAAIKTINDSIPEGTAGRGEMKFLHLDLADLKSVTAAAESFARQESKLDVLWNNAGIGANVLKFGERTAQDLEPFMGVHCVATLLFTQLLLPQLKAAASSSTAGQTRVVWLASGLMDSGAPKNGVDFSALDQGIKDRVTNYGASKAATWYLGREFARRYGNEEGILSVTINPGNLRAGSFKGTPAPVYFILNAFMLHEPVFGAYTELYAGLSPELKIEHNGTYVIPWGRRRPDNEITRKDILKAMAPEEEGGLGYAKKLWEWCEEQWKPHV
ncbi:NAD(P)-binding protein [Xylariaceae sp. FL1651]|nr:NAD(P)-binding protein [Xylariaceae sp. FL1651]